MELQVINMDFETISAKDIDKYIGKENTKIIDIRDYEEYKEGHIPTAVNIPYEQLERYMPYLNSYENLILYCERGNISLLASRDLSKIGYRTINIVGGIHAYRGKLSIDEN
jgi:Rhodanese-related sulfurtransferase